MPELSLTTTPFGHEALTALATQIATAKSSDPLTPVTVIVADHTHTTATRRGLAREGEGLAAVEFVTLAQLATSIAAPRLKQPDGSPLLPADQSVTSALARRALTQEPGIFAPIAAHPATADALAAAHSELRDIDDAKLDRIAAEDPTTKEVVRIHRAIGAQASGRWFDNSTTFTEACAAIDETAETTSPAIPANAILYLPEPLLEPERRFITKLAESTKLHVIAATSGHELADTALADSLKPLNLTPDPGKPNKLPTTTHILTTSDADDEVRFAVRKVVDALRSGTPADRIAIVMAAEDPYGRLLAEQLAAARVSFNGPSGRSVSEFAAARFLERLIRLDPDDLRRTDLFALLSSAPVTKSDGRTAPTSRWRHIAREHCANGSAEHWVERLQKGAKKHRKKAEEFAKDSGTPGQIAWHERAAEDCQPLIEFIAELSTRLRALQAATTWSELTELCQKVLNDHVRTDFLPDEDHAAEQALREILRKINVLDELGVPASLDELREILALRTANQQIRSGDAGTGVRVLTLQQAAGLVCDVAVICGCIEGALPKRPGVDPLLPGRTREELRKAGAEIRTPRDFVPKQHRDFLAACAAPAKELMLTMPRGDLRKTVGQVPSRWLLEVAAELIGAEQLQPSKFLELRDQPAIRHVQSFGSGLASLADPATEQEYRLREGLQGDPPATADQVFERNCELIRARRSREFTRFDGNLTSVEIPDLTVRAFSASRLNGYLSCPHASFLEYVLDVTPLPEDDEDEMTARDRGSMIHEVFERFIDESKPIEFGRKWNANDRKRLLKIADQVFDKYEDAGLTGLPLPWQIARLEMREQLIEFLILEQKLRLERRVKPVLTEFGFGRNGDLTPTIELRDGRTARLSGYIDRLDVGADGSILISDYKTGKQHYFDDITDDQPLGDNRLQLPIYALAAWTAAAEGAIEGASASAPVTAGYWFFGHDNGERTEVEISSETIERAKEIMLTTIDLMQRGIYPQLPPTKYYGGGSSCDVCAPGGHGIGDIARGWEQIKDDPALAELVALLPEDEDEEETEEPGE